MRRALAHAQQLTLHEVREPFDGPVAAIRVTLSLAAGNEARMRAMTAAKSNVSKMLDDLIGRSRQPRQEEVTNEIVELGGRGAECGLAPARRFPSPRFCGERAG